MIVYIYTHDFMGFYGILKDVRYGFIWFYLILYMDLHMTLIESI